MIRRAWTLSIVFVFLAGCGTLLPTTAPSVIAPTTAAVTGTPATPDPDAPTETPAGAPRELRVWVPSRFDPNAGTPAATALRARLDLYARLNPDVRLEVRVRDETESAGLLEMLSVARAAAPDTLPDLVALPRDELEDAALKSLIHPIEGLTDVLDAPDWYFYARQLGLVQNSAYGVPFAGDALVLAYDPAKFSKPPDSWDTILRRPGALALSADGGQVLFVISLYRSMNGGVQNAQNRPVLEDFALEPALSILEKARINRSIFVDTDDQAWVELLGGRAAWIITPATRAMAEPSGRIALAPLPGVNNDPFTLGTTWAWALAGSDPQDDAPAMELAGWLVQDQFLNTWTEHAGYLPVRSAAPSERFPALGVVAESAQPVPSNDVLAAYEPVLQGAAQRILGGEPVDVVSQDAVEELE